MLAEQALYKCPILADCRLSLQKAVYPADTLVPDAVTVLTVVLYDLARAHPSLCIYLPEDGASVSGRSDAVVVEHPAHVLGVVALQRKEKLYQVAVIAA